MTIFSVPAKNMKMNEKGIIAVAAAVTLPILLFFVLLVIEMGFYFMATLEANFTSLDLSRHLKGQGTVEGYLENNKQLFSSMCKQSDGSVGYEFENNQFFIEENIYKTIGVSCSWNFNLITSFPILSGLTPNFRYNVIYESIVNNYYSVEYQSGAPSAPDFSQSDSAESTMQPEHESEEQDEQEPIQDSRRCIRIGFIAICWGG